MKNHGEDATLSNKIKNKSKRLSYPIDINKGMNKSGNNKYLKKKNND